MKLADKWTEPVAASVASTDLHDEVEEHDEADEVEDGCGAVCVESYVLKAAQTSNKMLHELAREVRGVEVKRGKRFVMRQYETIFRRWESASRPYLRAGHDYFTEFLAKLDVVLVPKGETLRGALDRAKKQPPPAEILQHPNSQVRLFASLCRELHRMGGGKQIMLDQKSISRLFNCTWQTIGNWIKALKTIGVLKLAEPAVKRQRAARYFYAASDAAEEGKAKK